MTEIDQFESLFKSAAKARFEYKPIEIRRVLVVSDQDEAGARLFQEQVRGFLRTLQRNPPEWRVVNGTEFRDVGELLDHVRQAAPGLICTYRNLHSTAWKWPYSLGSHLDVLTQATEIPVLVCPHPAAGEALGHAMKNTNRVMALTDNLVEDHRLVNTAVAFTEPGGTLFLTHIEDQKAFDRFMDKISKIPSIDTDTAREEIVRRLLKEPRDYIESCREVLRKVSVPVKIEEVVTIGRRLEECKALVHDRRIDLLLMNTKDEDQLAMHGLAYPLAVELRGIPVLML